MDVTIVRQLRKVGGTRNTMRYEHGFIEVAEEIFREEEPSHRYGLHILRIRYLEMFYHCTVLISAFPQEGLLHCQPRRTSRANGSRRDGGNGVMK